MAKLQMVRVIVFLVIGIFTGTCEIGEWPIANFMLAFSAANFMTTTNNMWSKEDTGVKTITIVLGFFNAIKDAINDMCVFVCAAILCSSLAAIDFNSDRQDL
jgi:hypothetical protein